MSQQSDKPAARPESSKAEIRACARKLRRDLPEKDRLSRLIGDRFCSLPQYAEAAVLLLYMHVRDEVRTTELVAGLLQTGKRIVVPYCVGDELGLFQLADLAELTEGTLAIPEPAKPLRSDQERWVDPSELDLLAVPGLAFDPAGGRVGYGRGYFDRLLARLRPDAVAVGLGFECQMFDRVPMQEHDIPLDRIVTEKAVYGG